MYGEKYLKAMRGADFVSIVKNDSKSAVIVPGWAVNCGHELMLMHTENRVGSPLIKEAKG